MTIKDYAEMLNGREYGCEIAKAEEKQAKENGIVIVFGSSDDLMEFRGAIDDEVGCYNGGTAYLTEKGLFENECDDEDCPYAERERAKCKTITADWNDADGPCWTYETDIPHETFSIYDDDGIYCDGIVFELAEVAR